MIKIKIKKKEEKKDDKNKDKDKKKEEKKDDKKEEKKDDKSKKEDGSPESPPEEEGAIPESQPIVELPKFEMERKVVPIMFENCIPQLLKSYLKVITDPKLHDPE